jgi:hypothetical protein
MGRFSKFIVAAAGAVSTALSTAYGTEHWVSYVLAGLSAVTVFLVPNVPAVTAAKETTVAPKTPVQ